MSAACVLIVLDDGDGARSRPSGSSPSGGRSAPRRRRGEPESPIAIAAAGALAAALDETVVVLGNEQVASLVPDGVTVLLEEDGLRSEASSLRVALDWCARAGHGSVTVATVGPRDGRAAAPRSPELSSAGRGGHIGDGRTWVRVASGGASGGASPVAIGVVGGRRIGPVRLDASAWPLLPLTGEIAVLWHAHPGLVCEVELDEPGAVSDVPGPAVPEPIRTGG